jgi:N-acetylneuraminic acid mutarotase
MPTARYNLAAAVVYNASGQPVLYAIGGHDSVNTVLRRVEAYNAVTNTWTRKASLPFGRAQTNGANVIGGKIYLSGRVNSSGTTSSLYVYDPGTNVWITKASMPVHHYLHRLYRYDPATNPWSPKAPLPGARRFGAAAVLGKKAVRDRWGQWGRPARLGGRL